MYRTLLLDVLFFTSKILSRTNFNKLKVFVFTRKINDVKHAYTNEHRTFRHVLKRAWYP